MKIEFNYEDGCVYLTNENHEEIYCVSLKKMLDGDSALEEIKKIFMLGYSQTKEKE